MLVRVVQQPACKNRSACQEFILRKGEHYFIMSISSGPCYEACVRFTTMVTKEGQKGQAQRQPFSDCKLPAWTAILAHEAINCTLSFSEMAFCATTGITASNTLHGSRWWTMGMPRRWISRCGSFSHASAQRKTCCAWFYGCSKDKYTTSCFSMDGFMACCNET